MIEMLMSESDRIDDTTIISRSESVAMQRLCDKLLIKSDIVSDEDAVCQHLSDPRHDEISRRSCVPFLLIVSIDL
jgi:hypothetical protein